MQSTIEGHLQLATGGRPCGRPVAKAASSGDHYRGGEAAGLQLFPEPAEEAGVWGVGDAALIGGGVEGVVVDGAEELEAAVHPGFDEDGGVRPGFNDLVGEGLAGFGERHGEAGLPGEYLVEELFASPCDHLCPLPSASARITHS